MFLLIIPLKLTRNSSWLAYIQAQVTSTPGGTPILGHIRDVWPEWVGFPGRKPADGCNF